jgi:hypothetical protein
VRGAWVAGLVVVAAWLGWGQEARGEVRRFALVVGANEGEAGEVELRYAERDAGRFAQVLKDLGGVAPEDLVLLTDADAGSVLRVLGSMEQRIAQHRQAQPKDEVIFLVFYSGHADVHGLTMNRTRLDFSTLKQRIEGSSAQLRVLIVDACRSGEITRVKGASPAEPFKIDPVGRGVGEGVAIITSAASDEDAQESDRLQASFFTHHLLSGMLGAADTSKDKQVTLGEAYGYAYNETLRSTSRAKVVQHPTYWFEIRGRQDLVLTSLLGGGGQRLGRLRLLDGGSYVVFRGEREGALAAELYAEGGTEIALEEGTYLIRRRGEDAVEEVATKLLAGNTTTISADEMQRVPYGRIVRKGLGAQSKAAMGVVGGVGWAGPLVEEGGQTGVGQLGVQLDLEALSLQLRLRYGQARQENEFLKTEQRLLGGDAAVLKLFDLDALSLGFGLRAGVDWAQQRFEGEGVAPPRDAVVLRAGPVLHLGWSAAERWGLYLEGSGDAYLLTTEDTEAKRSETGLRFVPQAMVGAIFYVF